MPRDAREAGGADLPTREDRKRVDHILRTARDASIIVGDDAHSLAGDMIRMRALVNCFTEIGEAASRLSDAGRAFVGDFPWRKVVGMRNIVVHVYWGIDAAELIKTVRDDLPLLIAATEEALRHWPTQDA